MVTFRKAHNDYDNLSSWFAFYKSIKAFLVQILLFDFDFSTLTLVLVLTLVHTKLLNPDDDHRKT